MKTNQIEPLRDAALFDERELISHPPRIVELRRFYDEARAAYEAADARQDELGEEIPREIRMDYHHWERQLRIEEARVASSNVAGEATASKKSST